MRLLTAAQLKRICAQDTLVAAIVEARVKALSAEWEDTICFGCWNIKKFCTCSLED